MSEMLTVEQLSKEITESITDSNGKKRIAASSTDELKFMRTMLNDKEYSVDIVSASGSTEFSPALAAREVAASILSGAGKIDKEEASALASAYTFSKADAKNMIDISKKFVTEYTRTGRKLPLGGTELSDISLSYKFVPANTKSFQIRTGLDEEGNPILEKGTTNVPEHESMRVHGRCPSWVKNS